MIQGKLIKSVLSSVTAITDLVGTRIVPLRVPEKTEYPIITYQTISNVPYNSKSGFSNYKARMQVNVFETDYKKGVTLSTLVVDALADLAPSTYGGVVASGSKLISQTDQEEDYADGSGLVHFVLEFFIDYNG